MSLEEELDNEAASSQILDLSTYERKENMKIKHNDQYQPKILM